MFQVDMNLYQCVNNIFPCFYLDWIEPNRAIKISPTVMVQFLEQYTFSAGKIFSWWDISRLRQSAVYLFETRAATESKMKTSLSWILSLCCYNLRSDLVLHQLVTQNLSHLACVKCYNACFCRFDHTTNCKLVCSLSYNISPQQQTFG